MKNTLLAVLVISLCYYDIQAQVIYPQSPGYFKYKEVIPHHSIDKDADKANRISDGVAATDKLSHDMSAFNKMTYMLINSLVVFEDGNTGGKPTHHIEPVVFRQQGTVVKAAFAVEVTPINNAQTNKFKKIRMVIIS